MAERKWIVHYEEDKDEDYYEEGEYPFELSVVVENSHGHVSWGWADDEKIMLLHGGDLNGGQYSDATIERVKRLAQILCDELNAEERANG